MYKNIPRKEINKFFEFLSRSAGSNYKKLYSKNGSYYDFVSVNLDRDIVFSAHAWSCGITVVIKGGDGDKINYADTLKSYGDLRRFKVMVNLIG